MTKQTLMDRLEQCPVIAAVQDSGFAAALASPAEVIFSLGTNLLTVVSCVKQAHDADKFIFVHLDLAEGIGKDKIGIKYLAGIGVDGIITTRTHLVRQVKECGMIAVQRFFTLDSKGMDNIAETLDNADPDLIEIMPGVISKTVARFARGRIPVIAGGLIEAKEEVTAALGAGAIAVSTGSPDLWYI